MNLLHCPNIPLKYLVRTKFQILETNNPQNKVKTPITDFTIKPLNDLNLLKNCPVVDDFTAGTGLFRCGSVLSDSSAFADYSAMRQSEINQRLFSQIFEHMILFSDF